MVVNPNDTTHEIRVIPREYFTGILVVTIVDEWTELSATPDNTYIIDKGYLYVTFDHTFKERDNYRLTMTNDGNIIYRGNIFATSQDTQNFKLSEGVYL